jgi:hypothetical protein
VTHQPLSCLHKQGALEACALAKTRMTAQILCWTDALSGQLTTGCPRNKLLLQTPCVSSHHMPSQKKGNWDKGGAPPQPHDTAHKTCCCWLPSDAGPPPHPPPTHPRPSASSAAHLSSLPEGHSTSQSPHPVRARHPAPPRQKMTAAHPHPLLPVLLLLLLLLLLVVVGMPRPRC